MKKLLISISLLLCINAIYATNYYVSSVSGDDLNAGTLQFPWKTLSKVSSFNFNPGDVINFAGGETFYGSLIIHNSGTVGNTIAYRSYGTGQAILTGFTTVSSWSSLGNNIWESTASPSNLSTCNMVSINGVNTAVGRYPNSGWLTYQSFTGTSSITSSSLNSSVTNWAGAQVAVRKNNWIIDRCPITSASGSTINFTSTDAYNGTNGYGFFIQADIRTLDQQNEWYYNPTTKKIDVYSTTAPTNVQVASVNDLVVLNQNSYLVFDNLTLTGANSNGFNISGSGNLTIQNCNINYIGYDGVFGNLNYGVPLNNVVEQNNNFRFCNNMGTCTENEFIGIHITNNTFTKIGLIAGMADNGVADEGAMRAVFTYSDNALIENNRIDSIGYIGIHFHGSNVTVRNNWVTNFCQTVIDGGGIYTWFGPAARSTLINQKVYNNTVMFGIGSVVGTTEPFPLVHGIYMDDGTAHVEVYGNNCAHNSYSGLFIHNDSVMNVHDNTLYDNGQTQYLMTSYTTIHPNRNSVVKNNIFFARQSGQLCASYESGANDINLFGTIDSNYYARPIDDNLTIQTIVNFNTVTQQSLPMWQSFSGYDAHSHKAPVTITSAGQLDYEFNPYGSSGTATLPSGNFVDVKNVAYSGSTTINAYSSLVLMNTGSLITPTITYNNPANIVYGTPLSSTQLDATANVAGSFTYTIGSTTASVGAVLNAGTYLITANFTPSDPTTYSSASKTVTLIVTQAPATLSASNTTQTYTGAPLQPTITTNPNGLTVVSTTYNGVGQIPTNAASYSCVSGLSNQNYSAPSISYTFTINPAPVTIAVSNLNQTYTGSPLPVTVTTTPSVSGISVTYNGSSTVPTNAGSYTVVATLSNPNYAASPVTTTLVIAKATPTVTWATPAAITYGAALSGTQLNATASVAGAFTYTPASGTILNAGTNILSVNFTPTDVTNYNSVNNTTVSLVVNKATATISLSNLTQTYDGTPKPATVTTNPVGLTVITTTYNGSTTAPSAVGSYPVVSTLNNSNYTASPASGTLVISTSAASIYITNYANLVYNGSAQTPTVTCAYTYTITFNGSTIPPTNVGSYTTIATINDGIHTGADTVTMTIIKATPVIVWNNPTAVTYGTTLSATQLNATSTVAGAFTYSPVSGTLLNAGTYVLSVSFSPTDVSNYNTATATVNLTVNQASATLTLSNLNQTYDGTPKSVTVTSSPSGLSGITVTYNGSLTAPTNAGSYAVLVTLTNANYSASNVSGTLTIAKKNAVLSWSTPTAIPQGTPLSSTQLNATSDIAGSFTYTPAIGTILPTGTNGLSATFTPTDTVNYNTGTVTTTISVYGNPVQNYFIKHGKLYPKNL